MPRPLNTLLFPADLLLVQNGRLLADTLLIRTLLLGLDLLLLCLLLANTLLV